MEIRTERSSDYDEVYKLNYAAFGNREDEAELVQRIRSSEEFVPELSLVAEENDRIVGHALFSKAEIVDGETRHDVIVLAPIAVMPSHQKRGIGGQLIQEGINRSEALGYGYVFLIGHPAYYPKFGFKPARAYGFDLKQFTVPDNVFMVYPTKTALPAEKIKGELKYPGAFFP